MNLRHISVHSSVTSILNSLNISLLFQCQEKYSSSEKGAYFPISGNVNPENNYASLFNLTAGNSESYLMCNHIYVFSPFFFCSQILFNLL